MVDLNSDFGGRTPRSFELSCGNAWIDDNTILFGVNFADNSEAIFTASLTAIAAPKLETEVVFTSPRAGTFTIPSRNGFRYELLRSPDLSPSSSEAIIDAANGSGSPLTLDFDDRNSSSARAFFFVREIEL